MFTLNPSAVHFDEVAHSYSLGDKQLSGITSIIHRYIFPDLYNGVSQEVLLKAAERGTRIHNLVQMYQAGLLTQEDTAEIQPLLDACNGLQFTASEYLVSDNESVASAIDIVAEQDGKIYLCDIKTTSVLNIEYLIWQLSIYALLFELQNPTLAVAGLKAIHFRDGKCQVVDIERTEYAVDLLRAFKEGAETFDNPLHQLPEDMADLLNEYVAVDFQLKEIEQTTKPLEERKKAITEALAKSLTDKGLNKLESDRAKITVGKDSERQSFDLKAFQKSVIYTEHQKLYDDFIKTTTVKGRVTITLK